MTSSYKKNKDLQANSPIVFFQTFIYDNKTHYLICQTTQWEIGYMHGPQFNRLYKQKGQEGITSFYFVDNKLVLLGLKNGSIKYGTIDSILNLIPLNKIQSVNGKSIISIAGNRINEQTYQIYTFDLANTFKYYENFKYVKEIKVSTSIQGCNRIIQKQVESINQPLWMFADSDQMYPLLITMKQIQCIFSKDSTTTFKDLQDFRKNHYLDDQKTIHIITSLDFNIKKKQAVIGYQKGVVQVFHIQKMTHQGESRFVLEPFLKIKEKEEILSVSLSLQNKYLAFLTGSNGFFIDIQKRGNLSKRIKNSKERYLSVIVWTIDSYIIMANINGDKQRLYCSDSRIIQEKAE